MQKESLNKKDHESAVDIGQVTPKNNADDSGRTAPQVTSDQTPTVNNTGKDSPPTLTEGEGGSAADLSIEAARQPSDSQASEPDEATETSSPKNDDGFEEEFEALIKGKYKDAFAKRVQGIISKRFKEQKIAAEGQGASKDEPKPPHTSATEPAEGQAEDRAKDDFDLQALLEDSARKGAMLAAKSIADNLKSKGARPNEAGLSYKGALPENRADGLTPQQRRHLAHMAYMGKRVELDML